MGTTAAALFPMSQPVRKGRFLSVKRLTNIALNRLEKALGRVRLRSKPLLIHTDLTTKCNARCVFCALSVYDLPESQMDMDVYRRVADLFSTGIVTFLHGLGEPFLNRNIYEMTALAKQHGVKVSTNTNATALNRANAHRIVEAGIDVINISIDSTDSEQFAQIRRQTTLEQAVKGAEHLNEAKRDLRRATPVLGVAFVAMTQNVRELPGVVRLAKTLNARWVLAKGLLPWTESLKEQSLHNEPEVAAAAGRAAQAAAEESGIVLTLSEEFRADSAGKDWTQTVGRTIPCYEPWETIRIKDNGDVAPCCISEHSMGNLKQSTLDEIWNGPEYTRFRETMRSGRLPESCKGCAIAWQTNHSGRYAKVIKTMVKSRGIVGSAADLKALLT